MLRPKPVSDSRILGVDLRRLGYFARPQTACPILDRAAAWTGNRIFSQPVEEPLDDDCRIRLSGTSSRFDQCIVYQVVDIRLGVRQGVAAPFCVGLGPLDQAPFAVLLDHMRQLRRGGLSPLPACGSFFPGPKPNFLPAGARARGPSFRGFLPSGAGW